MADPAFLEVIGAVAVGAAGVRTLLGRRKAREAVEVAAAAAAAAETDRLVREVIKAARAEQLLHEAAHAAEHGEDGKAVHYDEGQRRTAIFQRVERELGKLKVASPANLKDLIS